MLPRRPEWVVDRKLVVYANEVRLDPHTRLTRWHGLRDRPDRDHFVHRRCVLLLLLGKERVHPTFILLQLVELVHHLNGGGGGGRGGEGESRAVEAAGAGAE